jgi:uncharacterized protein (DUF2164 family)
MLIKKIPLEHKQQVIRSIQQYFETERGETIGDLASEDLFDFIVEQIAPILYNQAIGDARKVAQQQMLSLEEELYALETPIRPSKRK